MSASNSSAADKGGMVTKKGQTKGHHPLAAISAESWPISSDGIVQTTNDQDGLKLPAVREIW